MFRVERFGFNMSWLLMGILGLFMALEWMNKQGLLPQITLPGFGLDSVGSVLFMGVVALSALISLRTTMYFIAITWFAYFCRANSQYPLLKAVADFLFSPYSFVTSRLSGTAIPVEHIGVFANLLLFLFISYILSKEQSQKIYIVPKQEKYRFH